METEAQLTALLNSDGETLLERLDHWANVRPESVCIYDGETDTEISYARFGRSTDAMAGCLAAQGITPGDRISVFTTNSVLAATVMFACWKSGAVYCPINFSYQGRLLAYQLRDTTPDLIITDSQLSSRIFEIWDDVVDDIEARVAIAEESEAPAPGPEIVPWTALTADAARPQLEIGPDDPANIVYTSGTTGPAKGVLQPHRWINQYTFGLRTGLDTEDVVYNDLPMYHVGGAFANVGRAIWKGCEAAIWNRFSPSEFWSRIERRGATCAILLDVMIPWLLQAPETEEDANTTLRKVYMQPLPLHHTEVARRFGFDWVAAGFGQTESGAPLNMFMRETPEGKGTPERLHKGPSDAEIRSVCEQNGIAVVDGADITRKGVMGRPGPFIDVAVLNDDEQECPTGTPGELAVRPRIAGMMMTEYIGRQSATAEAWRGGWFHTGDSALKDDDGTFRFIDRLGDRIRVRGENLSSFQVEDLLTTHPAVQMAAVFAVPSTEGDEDEIVAYVVLGQSETTTVEELNAYAVETMPKFMRPKHIRIVDDLPRTPTNKIEKYKLRRQFADELSTSTD